MTLMAELPDFEPEDGHRHDCQRRTAPLFATMLQANLTACDCAAQLYAIAAQAEEELARRRSAEVLPDYCLNARMTGPDHGPILCQREKGHDGLHHTGNAEGRFEW